MPDEGRARPPWGREQIQGALTKASERFGHLPDKLGVPSPPRVLRPPPAVEQLIVAPGGGSGEISVTWQAMDETITHFEVFRGEEPGGPYAPVAVVANTPAAWWPAQRRGIQDIDQFDPRTYIVRAVHQSGLTGPFSEEATGSHVFRPQ